MWNISTLVCSARKKKNLTVLMRNELLNKSSPFMNTGWTLQTTDNIVLWWSVLTSSLPSFLWLFPSAQMEKDMGSGSDKKTPILILPSFSKVFSLIKGGAVLVCSISLARCSNNKGPEGWAVRLYRSYTKHGPPLAVKKGDLSQPYVLQWVHPRASEFYTQNHESRCK